MNNEQKENLAALDAGKIGFEPTVLVHAGFQNRYFKPLSHLPKGPPCLLIYFDLFFFVA